MWDVFVLPLLSVQLVHKERVNQLFMSSCTRVEWMKLDIYSLQLTIEARRVRFILIIFPRTFYAHCSGPNWGHTWHLESLAHSRWPIAASNDQISKWHPWPRWVLLRVHSNQVPGHPVHLMLMKVQNFLFHWPFCRCPEVHVGNNWVKNVPLPFVQLWRVKWKGEREREKCPLGPLTKWTTNESPEMFCKCIQAPYINNRLLTIEPLRLSGWKCPLGHLGSLWHES